MRFHRLAQAAVTVAALTALNPAHAVDLIAIGTLGGSADFSGATQLLENGIDRNNALGGIGSGLAWAGGNTFLALPDRGPNATAWNSAVDNTTSYVARFQTLTLNLTAAPSGGLPYTLTPTLTGTTLLSSSSALNYGSAPAPALNTANKYFFTGRSDGFTSGGSLNPNNSRLDPEGIRMANNGNSVFVSDEYGPYVYQFDRTTGQRINSFTLPGNLATSNVSSMGATEISGNTSGRVANKGMEGLAISPDGKTLFGFMQSPLIQDGGDGGRANRIVSIDVATGATRQFAYDNQIAGKNYNSSELLAINANQVLVLERDGKGLGDGSSAKVKQLWAVDLSNAQDVSNITGEAALLPLAPTKTLFLDIAAALKVYGLPDTQIPAKLEGIAFGDDIVDGGITYHTLYLANDNDFVPGVAGDNKFFVFRFTDAELASKGLSAMVPQGISSVPEPASWGLMAAGMSFALWHTRGLRRRR